jgi:peptidoglycan/LPS O-acetylase OafA/YrhL
MNSNYHTKQSYNMQKYPALDGLRAYVAISIIMMHVLANITIELAYNFLRETISP